MPAATLVAAVIAIIVIGESASHLLVGELLGWHRWPAAFFDAGILLLIALPALYFWVILPIERRAFQLSTLEAKYRAIFEDAPYGIYQTSPDGRFLTANNAAARLLGYPSADALKGQAFNRNGWGYADPRFRDNFQRAIEHDGVVNDLEYEIVRKDGTRRWVSDNARVVRNSEGAVQHYEGVLTDITARKEAQAAQDRLIAILEATPDLVSIADIDGRLLYMNRAGRTMLGIATDANLDRFHLSRFHDEASAQTVLTVGIPSAIRDRIWTGDTNMVSLDGHATRMSQVILAHKAPDGRTVFLSTIARDIAERNRTRKELEERERLLQEAQAIGGLGSYVLDIKTGQWRSSAVLDGIFGIEPAYERSVEGWLALIHPDEQDAMRAYLATEVLGAGRRFDREYRIIRKNDGALRWVHGRGSLEVGEDGAPARLIGSIIDVTARKESHEALRLQSAALNAAANAIVITDRSGTIVWANRAALESTRYEPAEVLGKNPRDVFKSGVHDRAFYEALWATLTAGDVWRGEMVNRRKDGTHFTEDAMITPIRNDQGAITHFVAVKQDVTEKKALEQQFLRAQRLESIGVLAAGIAHDLNNVLAPIAMAADLLAQSPADDREALLTTITDSTRRGAEMVRHILSFARGTTGRRVDVQMRHLIREVERITIETFPKNITVRTHADHDLWTIEGDPTQLHQVLMNLCVNARDAMADGGQLTITATNTTLDERFSAANPDAAAGPHVMIEVEDTGSGIPASLVDRIFDPFFTTKEPGRGTGLGLSTSLGIVRRHGGFIRVASEPGRGTRFRVCLPAGTTARTPAAVSATGSKVRRGNGQTILVVDDEIAIREMTRLSLEGAGYHVLLASNGAEAVSAYSQHAEKIAAVLLDLMMPVMDGAATVQVLIRMNPEIRLIATSGRESKGASLPRTAAGPIPFLLKPYPTEDLLIAVQMALDEGQRDLDIFE